MNLQINMEAFRNGDEKEFKKIVNKFDRQLFYFCRKLVEDEQEAADVAIESLTKALLRCKDFDTPESLNAFLYITARNACYNKNRDKKRRNTREKKFAMTQEEYLQMVELQMIEDGRIRELIMQAIESLPDSCRTIFKLHYIEGMSISDIMTMLDKERNNVTNQLHTGREKIKRFLADKKNNHSR